MGRPLPSQHGGSAPGQDDLHPTQTGCVLRTPPQHALTAACAGQRARAQTQTSTGVWARLGGHRPLGTTGLGLGDGLGETRATRSHQNPQKTGRQLEKGTGAGCRGFWNRLSWRWAGQFSVKRSAYCSGNAVTIYLN